MCGSTINNPAEFGTEQSNVAVAPPDKFVSNGFLPPNWWVFGQPLLQQLYPVSARPKGRGNGQGSSSRLLCCPQNGRVQLAAQRQQWPR